MSSTEGAFAPDTVAYGYVHQSSRDDSQEAQSSREPFVGDDVHADARGPFAEQKPADEPIPALVERLLRGGGGDAVDGLPSTLAEELRVIGRAVSFSATTAVQGSKVRYYYTGLVCAVSAAAVTLMHVQRYTEADFEAYKHRERALSVRGRGSDGAGAAALADGGACGGGLAAHGYSAEGAVGVDGDGRLCGHDDGAALRRMDAAGSLTRAPPLPACAAAVAEKDTAVFAEAARAAMGPHTRAARRRPLAACGGSVGPLPYVTVQRQRMREVRFGRDPRSSFYALFQEPEKHIEDMQYLRMFVRRYLVHTCQGNNPRQVPLYAFVAARSGCGALDRSFVYALAREELPDLLRTDRAIEGEKKRRAAFEEQRMVSGTAGRQHGEPTGMFAGTGVLHRAGVPQRSLVAGLVLCAVTVVTAVYVGVSVSVLADPFVVSFLLRTLWFVVASLGVWTLATAATITHAFLMRVPLRKNVVLLVARAALCVCGVGCSLMCLVVLILRMSNAAVYEYMASQPKEQLCAFYEDNQCSGLYDSCNGWFRDRALCRVPCATLAYGDQTCSTAMWRPIQAVVLPLLVLSVLLLCVCLYSLLLVVNVIFIGRRVAQERS